MENLDGAGAGDVVSERRARRSLVQEVRPKNEDHSPLFVSVVFVQALFDMLCGEGVPKRPGSVFAGACVARNREEVEDAVVVLSSGQRPAIYVHNGGLVDGPTPDEAGPLTGRLQVSLVRRQTLADSDMRTELSHGFGASLFLSCLTGHASVRLIRTRWRSSSLTRRPARGPSTTRPRARIPRRWRLVDVGG